MSCDYFNDTRICNQTRKDIILKVTFDANVVKTWSGGMLVKNLTKTFNSWGDNLIPINIDTINYISTYLIKPDSCGHIEGGNNRRPNFHFYKEMEIISEFDTLKLRTKEQMRKAFDADRSKTKYNFDLLIQEGGKYTSR
jgi:outer membrane receptor for monomeric catechols